MGSWRLLSRTPAGTTGRGEQLAAACGDRGRAAARKAKACCAGEPAGNRYGERMAARRLHDLRGQRLASGKAALASWANQAAQGGLAAGVG